MTPEDDRVTKYELAIVLALWVLAAAVVAGVVR